MEAGRTRRSAMILLPVVALPQEPFLYRPDAMVWSREADLRDLAPVLVFAIVVAAVLVFTSIRARTRLEEKRLDLLRELSATGEITQRALEQHLLPRRAWANVVLVAAWFGLFGGLALLAVGIANGWRREYEEIGGIGIALLVLSIATITAPIALREMRRQGA